MSELQPEVKSLESASAYRACENCRLHKQRCLPDNGSTSGHCRRCVRAGRTCIFASRPDRRPRKRTDTRVAELEREVRAMRALIRFQEGAEDRPRNQGMLMAPSFGSDMVMSTAGPPRKTPPRSSPGTKNTSSSTLDPLQMGDPAWPQPDLLNVRETDPHARWPSAAFPTGDVIDRGVISQPVAMELLEIYKNDLFPHYPVVPLSRNMALQELRFRKPHLLLAVLAAAAAKVNPRLHSLLNAEVLQAYAINVVVNGEKTLELVQAMTVTAVWYFPPDHFSRVKFYEYIHMASTMALDIGLGSKPLQSSELLASNWLDTSSFESRRTILACYLNCSGQVICVCVTISGSH